MAIEINRLTRLGKFYFSNPCWENKKGLHCCRPLKDVDCTEEEPTLYLFENQYHVNPDLL